MMRHKVVGGGLLLALLVVAASAGSQPLVGARVPPFEARDLLGQQHSSGELEGRPTLVAVLTYRDADAMLPMLDRAVARYPGSGVHLVLILALDLSWYATTHRAIAVARGAIPEARWGDTWLDRSGRIQRAFALPEGTHAPFVFVLDPQGQITAMVRGVPTEADVQAIWQALPAP